MQENFNFFLNNLHFFVFFPQNRLSFCDFNTFSIICGVRLTGLEPARRETPDPKSDASTNSATGALLLSFLICGCKGTNFFSFHQEFTGKFYQRIFSLDKVGICERHFIVGVDAEFRLLVMAVVHWAS